ncbi:hypothetical protein DUNSADRAFT_16231 [Dunaliella salina]|uniref:Uncharacterized protein n=1 Tax=Dunaliella salina TaxID=3046 RepID=A0ABQ7H134_DUNSA|nr:hypothetical protein DUNSADRAFT_16231 [Dunaliella salina]|eukprot:KAF5840568.1 hypothetical protein DUNSADRAFT_16231 [Dunaliella salina]
MLLAKERDPGMAANLSLDGHRQVFIAFIQGFAAYSGLLGRIQTALEQTLKDGMHCAIENIHLRERMGEEAHKRKVAAASIRAQIMKGEQAFKQSAFEKLQQARERVQRATKRAAAAEKERDRARHQARLLEESVAALKDRQACLKALTAREVAASHQPSSGHVLALKIRPLNLEDKRLLEQEHGNAVAYVLGEEPEPATLRNMSAEGQPEEPFLPPSAFATAVGNELLPPGPTLTPLSSPRRGHQESTHESISMTLSAGEGEQVQQQKQHQQQQQQHEQGHGQQSGHQHAQHHRRHQQKQQQQHHHQQQQEQQQHEHEHGQEEDVHNGHTQGGHDMTEAGHQGHQGSDQGEQHTELQGQHSGQQEQQEQQEKGLEQQQQEHQEHQQSDANHPHSETQVGGSNGVEHVDADQAQAAEAGRQQAAGADVPLQDEGKGKTGAGKKGAAGKKGKDKVSSSTKAPASKAPNPHQEEQPNGSIAGEKATSKAGASKGAKGKKGAAPPSKGKGGQ